MLIPRVFHQIWIGPDPFPEELVDYQETWLRHNQGWELRLWTEENLPERLRRPEIYERLRVPAERADMLRLEVVWMFGGVYIDADFECLRPIEPLIEDAEFFAGYRKPGRVNNALFGAVAGHPLLERAIREVRPRETYGPVDKDWTGPRFLNRLVKEFPAVTIFAPDLFYPRTPEARRSAYAFHHKARSWQPTESLQAKLLEAEGQLREAQDEALEWRLRCEQAEAKLARPKNGFSLLGLRQLLARR